MCVYTRVLPCFHLFFSSKYILFVRGEREREKKSYVARALSVNLLPCQNLNKNKIVRDFFGGGGLYYVSFLRSLRVYILYLYVIRFVFTDRN